MKTDALGISFNIAYDLGSSVLYHNMLADGICRHHDILGRILLIILDRYGLRLFCLNY